MQISRCTWLSLIRRNNWTLFAYPITFFSVSSRRFFNDFNKITTYLGNYWCPLAISMPRKPSYFHPRFLVDDGGMRTVHGNKPCEVSFLASILIYSQQTPQRFQYLARLFISQSCQFGGGCIIPIYSYFTTATHITCVLYYKHPAKSLDYPPLIVECIILIQFSPPPKPRCQFLLSNYSTVSLRSLPI